MADTKISQLTVATSPIAGTDVLPLVQGGQTVKVPANQLLSYGSANGVVYLNASRVTTADAGLVYTGSLLGVGTTPAAKLHVNAGASNEALRLDAAATFNTGINWYGNNVIKFAMQVLGDGTDAFRLYNFNTGADAVVVDSSSNLKVSANNLVIGTAAKGVNFTANTPAAGMTSQLLNWYEEGTWTPNQGAGLTVNGAFSSSGTYTRKGREVTVIAQLNGATDISVGAIGQFCSNAPFTANSLSLGTAMPGSATASGGCFISGTSITSVAAFGPTGSLFFTITYIV